MAQEVEARAFRAMCRAGSENADLLLNVWAQVWRRCGACRGNAEPIIFQKPIRQVLRKAPIQGQPRESPMLP